MEDSAALGVCAPSEFPTRIVFAVPRWATSFVETYSTMWLPHPDEEILSLTGHVYQNGFFLFSVKECRESFEAWFDGLKDFGVPFKVKWGVPFDETKVLLLSEMGGSSPVFQKVICKDFFRRFATSSGKVPDWEGGNVSADEMKASFRTPSFSLNSQNPPLGWNGDTERNMFLLASTAFCREDKASVLEKLVSAVERGAQAPSEGWDSSLFTILVSRLQDFDLSETFARLLNSGCDPNKVNVRKNNALHSFLFHTSDISRDYVEKMVRLLVSRGCDPKARNELGFSPAQMFGKNKNVYLGQMSIDDSPEDDVIISGEDFMNALLSKMEAESLRKKSDLGLSGKCQKTI